MNGIIKPLNPNKSTRSDLILLDLIPLRAIKSAENLIRAYLTSLENKDLKVGFSLSKKMFYSLK